MILEPPRHYFFGFVREAGIELDVVGDAGVWVCVEVGVMTAVDN